ncbi:peptidase inhibitor family I36 protein [Streptomyces sp. NPDC093516]|uniref:peptidase inhibitor family I36 protein n=1 Tax=Streptomyces sp. NPDC093516 TaxID=3155304 RepID=UPI00343791E2
MKKRIVGAAVAVGAALALAPLTASPAAAEDAHLSICLSYNLEGAGNCQSAGAGYGISNLKEVAWGGWNDTISSVNNRTPYRYCFYVDAGYQGTSWSIDPWQWSNVPSYMDNKISSLRPC